MKKFYIPIISIFALIVIFLIAFMVDVMNNGPISKSWSSGNFSLGGTMKVVSDETYSSDGIENINVDFSSDEVKVFLNDTEKIHVIEYMSKTPDDDELAIADINGDTFKLYRDNENYFSIGINNFRRVEVYLPKSYLKNLLVETSSGGIKLEDDLTLVNCNLSASSGSIKTNSVNADELNCKTTSGSIKLEDDLNLKSCNLSASSGSIKTNSINTDEINCNTTSGSIRSEKTIKADNADFEASSGSINLYEVNTEKIEADTTSGSIKIEKVTGAQDFSSSNGSINIGEAEGVQEMSTSSGSISVENIKGGGSYKSTSGGIRLEFDDINNDVTCEASSGSVKMEVSDDESFNFKAKSSSGSIHTYFDDIISTDNDKQKTAEVGDKPEFDVNLTTTSGGISIS